MADTSLSNKSKERPFVWRKTDWPPRYVCQLVDLATFATLRHSRCFCTAKSLVNLRGFKSDFVHLEKQAELVLSMGQGIFHAKRKGSRIDFIKGLRYAISSLFHTRRLLHGECFISDLVNVDVRTLSNYLTQACAPFDLR